MFQNSSAFSDAAMTHLLPPNERHGNMIFADDPICRNSQVAPNQTLESPPLAGPPSSTILLMYQENGHVTQLNATPDKASSDIVSTYRTSSSLPSDTLRGIHNVWTADGHGGDGRSRLLSRAPFDDGGYYQISSLSADVNHRKDSIWNSKVICGTAWQQPYRAM